MVKSESMIDTCQNVDMTSSYCDCRAGQTVAHVNTRGRQQNSRILPSSISYQNCNKIRALYQYIADETFCTDEQYRDLDKPNKSTNVSEFVEVRTTTASSSNDLFENV